VTWKLVAGKLLRFCKSVLISANGFLISSGMPGKAVPPGVVAPPVAAGVEPPTGLPRVAVGAAVAGAVVGLAAVVGAAVGAKVGGKVAVGVASPQAASITRAIIVERQVRKNLPPEKRSF